jgi:phytoene dehydrogenase-like protein
MVRRFAKLMTTLYRSRPPKLVEQKLDGSANAHEIGHGLKLLGREYLRDLMRIVMINIYDVMNEHFSNAALKSTIALDAVTGTNMGPRSPNTVYSYLHRATGEHLGSNRHHAGDGRHGCALGSLWPPRPRKGATVQLGSAVSAIVKTEDRVTGVSLTPVSDIGHLVISSADPTTTFRDCWAMTRWRRAWPNESSTTGRGAERPNCIWHLSALPSF